MRFFTTLALLFSLTLGGCGDTDTKHPFAPYMDVDSEGSLLCPPVNYMACPGKDSVVSSLHSHPVLLDNLEVYYQYKTLYCDTGASKTFYIDDIYEPSGLGAGLGVYDWQRFFREYLSYEGGLIVNLKGSNEVVDRVLTVEGSKILRMANCRGTEHPSWILNNAEDPSLDCYLDTGESVEPQETRPYYEENANVGGSWYLCRGTEVDGTWEAFNNYPPN